MTGPFSQIRTFSVSERRSRAEISANALKLFPGASNVCLTVRELKTLVPRVPKRLNPVEFAVVGEKNNLCPPPGAPRGLPPAPGTFIYYRNPFVKATAIMLDR